MLPDAKVQKVYLYLAGLLALTGVLGVGEGHLLRRVLGGRERVCCQNQKVLSESPRTPKALIHSTPHAAPASWVEADQAER